MSSIATLSARAIARTTAFKTSKARANARRPARHIARASADVDEALAKAQCPIADVKDTIGRGFVIVDIRSPEEWQEGSKSTWKKICLAVFDEETGEVEMNQYFMDQISDVYPNTLSPISALSADLTARSAIAWRRTATPRDFVETVLYERAAARHNVNQDTPVNTNDHKRS